MKVKGLKVIVIVIAVVVTLALLFGIKFVNERFNIEKPLFKLYSETELVLKPSLERQGEITTISLTLKKTDNLFQAYRQINRETEKVLGDSKFEFKIEDNRSQALEDAFRSSQFVVYEALAKGNYTLIPAEVKKHAEAIGADARVYIDQENIYISLYKGDKYLYEVIPRKNPQLTGAVADTMGSESYD